MKLKLLILIMLALSGCCGTKYQIRHHHNGIEQQMQQSKDGETADQNWARRPQGNWPFQFLY